MNETNRIIFEKLVRLSHMLRRQHMKNHEAHGPFADPSRGQGRIIAMLKIKPEIATRELAYLLGVRQQSLNELLGKLEKNGYIERHPSAEDRRVVLVSLTEKGKQVEEKPSQSDAFLSCLSDEELETLSGYLDRLIEALRKQMDPEGKDAALKDLVEKAKESLGEEGFEQLMAMSRPRPPHHHPEPPHCGPHPRPPFPPESFPDAPRPPFEPVKDDDLREEDFADEDNSTDAEDKD